MSLNKVDILLYYPQYASGGHHKFYGDMFYDCISYLENVYFFKGTNGIKPSIKASLVLSHDFSANVVIIPNMDAYVKELTWNRNYSSEPDYILLWFDPLCYKTGQISNILLRYKEKLRRFYIRRNKLLSKSKILITDEYALNQMKPDFDVSWVPDPPPFLPSGDKSLDKEFDFLFYGAMNKTKGLGTLIKALNHVHNQGIPFKLKILGYLGDNILSDSDFILLQRLIDEDLISHTNRWVEDSEIIYYLERSETVVLPYENFYSTSGVLVTACAFKKKILVSDNTGTLSNRIIDNDLGLVFRQGDYIDLASKLIYSQTNNLQFKGQASFVRKHNKEWFSQTIRNKVLSLLENQ